MIYIVLLALGILLLVIGLLILKNSLSYIRTGNKTMATVIDWEESMSTSRRGGPTIMYQAVLKFKTSDNQEIIFVDPNKSSSAPFNRGEEIKIVYDTEDPSTAKTLTYFGIFGAPVLLITMAMPLLVVGGGYFLAQFFLK